MQFMIKTITAVLPLFPLWLALFFSYDWPCFPYGCPFSPYGWPFFPYDWPCFPHGWPFPPFGWPFSLSICKSGRREGRALRPVFSPFFKIVTIIMFMMIIIMFMMIIVILIMTQTCFSPSVRPRDRLQIGDATPWQTDGLGFRGGRWPASCCHLIYVISFNG